MTEKALIFSNGSQCKRISYPDIRNLSVSLGERHGKVAHPRLSVVLDGEELEVVVPVRTEKPIQLASLISDFVTNKRYSVVANSKRP